jgi:RHS repeat-associated protein
VDPAGNRSSRASTLASLGPQSFSYDANDELTTDSYDLNGNTTSSGGHSYSYDFENRLASKDGGAVTIVYDGDGNRVAKSAGGVTTKYLVDEFNPTGYLQVMDEVSGGAVQVRYTFGNILVSQTRNPSTSAVTSFYGYDAHGNVAFLTDLTGADTDTYAYDAWGNLIGRTGTTLNTHLFVGEELDADLGLINLRARYYNQGTGRLLTLDPLDIVPTGRQTPGSSLGQLIPDVDYPYAQAGIDIFTSDLAGLGIGNLGFGPRNRLLYAKGDPIDLVDPTGLTEDVEYAIQNQSVAQQIAVTRRNIYIGKKVACWLEYFADLIDCDMQNGTQNMSGLGLCMVRANRSLFTCLRRPGP